MKRSIHLLILMLSFGSIALSAQSNNEFKINPFQWSYTASSPALVFEHTSAKYLAWEIGYTYNRIDAPVCDPYFGDCPTFFRYRRRGVYGAARWYFSEAGRCRGVFLGVASAYNEPIAQNETFKAFLDTDEGKKRYFKHKEKQFYLGPLVGYKFVFWEHLVVEGQAMWSPYYTKDAIKVKIDNVGAGKFSLRGFAAATIGYRF